MSTSEALIKETEKNQKLEVPIAYNGMNVTFRYTKKKTVGKVREAALDHYRVHGAERAENFLFGPDNQTELSDELEMGKAVQPRTQLYLRRRAAGGGRA